MEPVLVALIASLVGLVAGAALTKFLLASQARTSASQLSELKNQCDALRAEAQNAAISETRATAERDAALSKSNADREANVALNEKIERLTTDLTHSKNENAELGVKLSNAVSLSASKDEELGRERQLVEQRSTELTDSKAANSELAAKLSAAETLVASKDGELSRQKQWIEEQTQHLQALFANSANQLLQERATQFGEANKEQIGALLEPFKQQLTDFRQRVDEIHSSDATARGALENHIQHLALTASQVGAKADLLANAMLGNAKQQGEWGQLQLTTLLEKAGFVEGKHFENQYSGEGDDNETRIADTVLWLPNKETLVIDAKVSLPSWTRFCEAKDSEAQERERLALVASIRAHYQNLAAKDYAQIVGRGQSVPFTVMFVPIEAAGIEAFRAAPDLFSDAQKRKIIIVTPTTLFCVLHLVYALWNIHDKQANALDIADHGRRMLKKLGTFLDSFAAIGNSLQSALTTYDTAKGQLQDGRGNLVSLASRMAELGVEAPPAGELPRLIAMVDESPDEELSDALSVTSG